MTSRLSHLECTRCGRTFDKDQLHNRCSCGGTLSARYLPGALSLTEVRVRAAGMWRYRELLPVAGEPVSLGEVETPLTRLEQVSDHVGSDVRVKDDGPLAGGTFKARGAAVALSRAIELGVRDVVMPTAGNAGGAWAAYAAAAGLHITVTMSRTAPKFNRVEVVDAGGELILVDGTIADAGDRAAEISQRTGAFLASTFNEPFRLEGKKTCWLEVYDRLGSPGSMTLPRTAIVPVGGGVAALAVLKAAEEARACGWTDQSPPRVVGVQAKDCAPIVRAFDNDAEVEPWPGDPSTIAAGLRVPRPSEGDLVCRRVRDSGGRMLAVDDDEMTAAIVRLARAGIDACPEGAATLVALDRLQDDGDVEGPTVLYNTGRGSKYAVVP